MLLDAAGCCSAMGPVGAVGRVVLNRSSRRAASLVGWGLFLPPVVGGTVADKSQPTKSEAFMAGGANGSRVAEYTQDSGLILASVTRLRGGCKFGGLGFVWWSATRGKRQRQMPAHQMCYLLLPDLFGNNCYRTVALF